MPYIMPNTTPTSELTCRRVFIPDEPEFRAALLGALHFFSTWVAWDDRTGQKREWQAAEVWKIAQRETLRYWAEACPDCEDCMKEDEVRELIDEVIEAMTICNNITVNCGGNCGCGGSGGGGGIDTQPPPDYADPITEPLPEPDKPPFTQSYSEYKCSMSYRLHYDFRSAILQIDNLWTIGEANYERVDEELAGTLGWVSAAFVFLWEAYYNLMTFLGRLYTTNKMYEVISEWDRMQSEVVCALYNADGVNDARSRFIGIIDNLNVSWDSRYWLKLLEQNIDYAGYLYHDDWQNVDVGDSWVGRDCSACGSEAVYVPEIDPEGTCLPSTYQFRVIAPETLTPRGTYTNIEHTYDQESGISDVLFSASSSSSYSTPDIDIDYPQVEDGYERIGFVYQLLESSTNNATGASIDGFNLDTVVAPSTRAGTTQAGDRACLGTVMTELFPDYIGGDAGSATLNWTRISGELDRPSSGTATMTFKIRVWEIVRVI